MKRLLNFLKYNNAVPITLSVILLGAGSAFAASPEVRDTAAAAVLSEQSSIVSIDNTYIVNKDLDTYTPQVQITGVTEDTDNYYISYELSTIDLQDYAWRDIVRQNTMQVYKKDLDGGDLGLYMTHRLNDVVQNERTYLAQVQGKERKSVSQKTVVTTYSGLIGKFLDATTETLPGYTPVIAQEVASGAAAVAVAAAPGQAQAPAPSGSAQVSLQVLGNNPAQLPLHASYIDLGVLLQDPFGTNVGVHTFLDGVETASPVVDTSTSSAHTIEYRVTDRLGNLVVARRIVLVGDAADPGGEISATAPVNQASAPPVQPTPTVTPQPLPPAPAETPPPTEILTPDSTSTPQDASSTSAAE